MKTLSIAWVAPLLLAACGGRDGQHMPRASVEVGVVTLSAEEVTVTTELTGRTTAVATAEVRPQVDGIIEARLFDEGTLVHVGQPLYQIDARRYRAARDEAAAQLEGAEAAAVTAQAKADRYTRLKNADAVAKQEVDDAVAAAREAQASIRQYRASLESANVNLAFTRISAPITGRIGRSAYTKGALVTSGQSTALATISQLDPMYVDIQQSSAAVLDLRESHAKDGTFPTSLSVQLTLENGRTYTQAGTLEFGEALVDSATGTMTLRASFPNPNDILLPGMFVRVTVPQNMIKRGILAPQQGITRDAKGNATALVVDANDVVVQRDLITQQAIGDKWLVTVGLAEGDRLIVQGADKVQTGATVKPVSVTLGD